MRRITLLQVLGYWNLHSGGYKLRTVGYEMRTTPACAEWPICRYSRRATLGFIFILRNRCGWVAPSPKQQAFYRFGDYPDLSRTLGAKSQGQLGAT